MNKRLRKKKKGIGQDYPLLPHMIAEQIYKEFCIPEQIIKNRAKETHLQYRAYMNLHRSQT